MKKLKLNSIRKVIVFLRWLLFIPLSAFITAGSIFLIGEKYTKLNPELFQYQLLSDLVPGLEPPNQSELLPYWTATGLLAGFGWILIGTLISPSKKLRASSILFLLTTAILIICLIARPEAISINLLSAYIGTILTIIVIHPKKIFILIKSRLGGFVISGLMLTTIIIFGLFYYHKQKNKIIYISNKAMELEEKFNSDRITIDMNGDGLYEMLVNPLMADNYDKASDQLSGRLTLYNNDKTIIAKTPDWFGSAPLAISMDLATFPKPLPTKDLAQINVIAGPHQTETMFLQLAGDELWPLCKVEEPNGIEDCLFYSSRGKLGVWSGKMGGLGKDNLFAIVEYVDEYPSTDITEALDEETKAIIDETFGELSEQFTKIAEREAAGKGKRVAWEIYIFNFDKNYFENQTGFNYDKYFELLRFNETNLMKKSEMSNESIEYTESTRALWTHR